MSTDDRDTLRMQLDQVLANQESQRQLQEAQGKSLEAIDRHLTTLNGKSAKHDQTLYGVDGRGGLLDDVRNLFKLMDRFRRDRLPPGTVSLKTVWGAVGALAAVASVVVAFVVGFS